MLNINIELFPFGDASKARTLGAFQIANDGTGDTTHGNYLFRVDPRDEWTKSVQGWPRDLPVGQLVYEALHLYYGK